MSGWWTAAFVAQWVLLVVLCVVVVALARQVGTLHLRLGPRGALEIDTEGPALGEPLPPVDARGADGDAICSADRGRGGSCCSRRRPASSAGRWRRRARGGRPADLAAADRARPRCGAAFEVPGTPFLLVLDELGVVRAKGTVNNLEQVEGLVDTAERRMREDGERWAS